MNYEKSCGALVVRRDPDSRELYLLMIRHRPGGYRSFPKGHVEPGETERATAIREVREETAAEITILPDFRQVVYYTPTPAVEKEVVYFLATTDNPAVCPQHGEIAEVEWVPLSQAEKFLTHANDKRILRAAQGRLSGDKSV